MHWWQGAFSSSSKLQDDDGGNTIVKYSAKPGFFASRRSRLIQRARKLRHINENDGELCHSPNQFENSPAKSPASATPLPLPLPELHVLFRGDHKVTNSISYGVPLPSPEDAVHFTREKGGGGCEERELNGDANDGGHGLKRIVDQDTRANAEHSETRSSKKSPQRGNAREIYSHTYSINIPTTSPNSPYSCQTPSPRTSEMLATQYITPSGVFHVWSAPEMRHSDRNLGLGYSYRFPYEKTASSFDNSPIQSPSKHVRVTSPPRPASPLGWRESNAQTTVHPLPLPPMASTSSQTTPISPVSEFSVPSQSTPISSNAAKPEFLGSNVHSQPSPLSPAASKPIMKPIKSQWQKGKLIGRGTFGSVYVASNRQTGALCAMKEVEILPDDSKSAESIRQLEQEIKVLSHLKHPNIVQYYGSEIVGDKFYIYLEYVHPGSINKFIHDHCEGITESVVRNFTRHILSGLAYLHSKKTIHRDIKGANLLVDAYGVVKLADFGMAKHLSGQAENLSLKGSPYWLAPELLQSVTQKDTSTDLALAVDIWSLGCTIIEMMDGKPPWSEYEGAAALFKVLQETPPIPETLSAEGKDFLQCCFHRNPADRPTASKLLDHPFLNY